MPDLRVPVAGGRRKDSNDRDSDTRDDHARDDNDSGRSRDGWVPVAGPLVSPMDVVLIRPPGLPAVFGARPQDRFVVSGPNEPHSVEFTVLHGLLRSVQIDPTSGEMLIVDNASGQTVVAITPPVGRDQRGRQVPSEFTAEPNGDGTSTLTQTLLAEPQTVAYPVTADTASGGLSPQWAAAALLTYRLKDLYPNFPRTGLGRLGELGLQVGEQFLPIPGVHNLATATADEVARATAAPPGKRDSDVTTAAKNEWLGEKTRALTPRLGRMKVQDPGLFRRVAESVGLDPANPRLQPGDVARGLAEAEWGRNSLVPTHTPDRPFLGRDVIGTATGPIRDSPLRSSIPGLGDLTPDQVPAVGKINDILKNRSDVPLTGHSGVNSQVGATAQHAGPNVSAIRDLAHELANSGRGTQSLDGMVSALIQRPDGTATLVGPDSAEVQRAVAERGLNITQQITDTANPAKPYVPGRTPTIPIPAQAPKPASLAGRAGQAAKAAMSYDPAWVSALTNSRIAGPVLRGAGKASPLLFPAAVVLDVNQGKTAGEALVTNGTGAVLGGAAGYGLFLAGASAFPVLLVGAGVGIAGYEGGKYLWNNVLSEDQRSAISNTISKADWGPVDPSDTKAGWSTKGAPGTPSSGPILPNPEAPKAGTSKGITKAENATGPVRGANPIQTTTSGSDSPAPPTPPAGKDYKPEVSSPSKPASTAPKAGTSKGVTKAQWSTGPVRGANPVTPAPQPYVPPTRAPIAPSTNPAGKSAPALGKPADLDEM